MAKKENKLSFGQLPTPKGVSSYMTTKLNWIGLNKMDNLNTGELSFEKNISTQEHPYLTPAKKILTERNYANPLGLFAFDDKIIVLYNTGTIIKADLIGKFDGGNEINLTVNVAVADDEMLNRIYSVVMFNQFKSGLTALDGTYSKKIVFLPLKRSMPFEFEEYEGTYINDDKDTLDKNKMYWHRNEVNDICLAYVWKGEQFVCVSAGENEDYCLPQLEVNVKEFYNDGYKLTSDTEIDAKTYYIKTEEGDKESYSKVASPKETEIETYYEYAYGQYYPTNDTKLPATKTYYTMTETNGVRTYEPVSNPDESKLDTYYEKCWEYAETSDSDIVAGKGYYVKNGNTYTCVTVPDKDDIENYYEITGVNYGPPSYADTSAYYFNAYNSTVYAYVTDEQADLVENEDYTSGWKVTSIPSFPDLKYATVHQSRLFGVSGDMIYASGFNDYSNWNYDTILDENANNAWYSTAQANVKATGEFTGIATYGNHVIAFKRDFMHEIYNNKNPFRIVDIGAYGTIDNRSICEVGGKLIFVSESNVCIYTGATPRNIGDNLNIDRFTYAVACSYKDRFYYLFCRDGENNDYLFVYDTKIGAWSELYMDCDASFDIVDFAVADDELYAFRSDGALLKLTGDAYADNWEFETDIATGTSSSSTYENVNIKHIRKIQLLVTMKAGSKFKIYGLYDHSDVDDIDKSKNLLYDSEATNNDKTTFAVRIKPRKTAGYGFKLHFEGSGYVKFGEIEVYMTKGGELFE